MARAPKDPKGMPVANADGPAKGESAAAWAEGASGPPPAPKPHDYAPSSDPLRWIWFLLLVLGIVTFAMLALVFSSVETIGGIQ